MCVWRAGRVREALGRRTLGALRGHCLRGSFGEKEAARAGPGRPRVVEKFTNHRVAVSGVSQARGELRSGRSHAGPELGRAVTRGPLRCAGDVPPEETAPVTLEGHVNGRGQTPGL